MNTIPTNWCDLTQCATPSFMPFYSTLYVRPAWFEFLVVGTIASVIAFMFYYI